VRAFDRPPSRLPAIPPESSCGDYRFRAEPRRAVMRIAVAWACALLGACLATKYRGAGDATPPAVDLALTSEQAVLELTLHHVIVYNGPGSWKREALWDEYVVSIGNRGTQVLSIDDVVLIGVDGARHLPGAEPWKLEKQSQTLAQRYLRNGKALARSEIPDAVVYGSSSLGGAMGTTFSAASAALAAASVYGLPVYYVVVLTVDQSNKSAMGEQFQLRRLALPRTLWPGEVQTGSFFFPMTPDPQSLSLRWSAGAGQGVTLLPLPLLDGLHGAAPAGPQAAVPPRSARGPGMDPTSDPAPRLAPGPAP